MENLFPAITNNWTNEIISSKIYKKRYIQDLIADILEISQGTVSNVLRKSNL